MGPSLRPLAFGRLRQPGTVAALQRPIPAVSESALHTSSPLGRRKEKAALIAPGLDPPLGSDLHHLPPWFPGPQPAPASPLSALSGAAPPPEETALCPQGPSASPGSPRVPCLEHQAMPSDPGPTQRPLTAAQRLGPAGQRHRGRESEDPLNVPRAPAHPQPLG